MNTATPCRYCVNIIHDNGHESALKTKSESRLKAVVYKKAKKKSKYLKFSKNVET